MKTLNILLILLLLASASCMQKQETEEQQSALNTPILNHDEVLLTKNQVQVTGIQMAKLQKQNITSSVQATGTLQLPPQNKATVSTLIGGIINQIYVIQGDSVKKGQILATIENPQIIQMQENYLKDLTNLRYLKKEYERQKELSDQQIIAVKKFQQAETNYETQLALINSQKNQLELLGISPASIHSGNILKAIPIISPIAGYIHKINVNTGSYVDPNMEIITVVDNHHVHIELQVFEKDVDKVKTGQTVYFSFSETGRKPYEARVFAIGKAYDPATRSISVHAEIKNEKEKRFMPGMYVYAIIITDSARTPALPEDAVISQGDLHFAFALEQKTSEGNESAFIFKKIPVNTGQTQGGLTEIKLLEPVPDSTLFVQHGAYYLKAKMSQGGEPEE